MKLGRKKQRAENSERNKVENKIIEEEAENWTESNIIRNDAENKTENRAKAELKTG